MKKLICYFLLSLVLINQTVFAEDKKLNLKEKWVALVWKEGEKPIVMPVLSDSEKECMQFVKEVNDITKSTVKIDRQVSCQPVIVK